MIKELTRAEEQIMQVLWKIKKGFVKDVLEELHPPKPAYNTISTIIRILEKKGMVGYKSFGKSHEYFPLISLEDYKRFTAGNLLENYFEDSPKRLLSFFVKEKQIDIKELEEIIQTIKNNSHE
jgi:predicted transcriptional regulator